MKDLLAKRFGFESQVAQVVIKWHVWRSSLQRGCYGGGVLFPTGISVRLLFFNHRQRILLFTSRLSRSSLSSTIFFQRASLLKWIRLAVMMSFFSF